MEIGNTLQKKISHAIRVEILGGVWNARERVVKSINDLASTTIRESIWQSISGELWY